MTPRPRSAVVTAVSLRGEAGKPGHPTTADVGLRFDRTKGPPDVWVTVKRESWPLSWPPRAGQAVRYTAAVLETEG